MKTFFVADTHLDHENIIKYCNRPFKSVEDMNNTIVANWNSVVSKEDIVYHLGDWGYGRGHRSIDYWANRLNGIIITVLGGHDRYPSTIQWSRNKVINYAGSYCYLVHKPQDVLRWNGIIIHGHKHNSQMNDYPFINGKNKTINVGVELTNYTPVDINLLMEFGFNSNRKIRTINDI
jgi:calcineurin-like phosphoesterase family protein